MTAQPQSFYRGRMVNPAVGDIGRFRGEKLEKIKQFFSDERNQGRKYSSLALHNTFGTTAFRSRVSDINKKPEHAEYGFVIRNEHFWDAQRNVERSFYWSEPENRIEREMRIARGGLQ